MAQELPNPESPPPPLDELTTRLTEQLFDVRNLTKVQTTIANAVQYVASNVIGMLLAVSARAGAYLAGILADAEDKAAPEFQRLAEAAVKDLFGVSPPVNTRRGGSGDNAAAANAIGEMLFAAFGGSARGATGERGELIPSDAPAKAFLSTMTQLALEGWLEGTIVELSTFGQVEAFGELDDIISHVLGLGRASASVHGPLVSDLIVKPLQWKLNKEHRPTLLSTSTALRQWARGRWDWADVVEELARQGYSDERIDALKNEQRRFLSVSDVALLAHRIAAGTFDATGYLREAGYDDIDARDQLLAEETRRLDAQEKAYASAAIAAYNRGDIGQAEFYRAIDSIRLPPDDTAHYKRLGDLQAGFQHRRLSGEQAARLARAGVLAVADARQAWEREGYPPEDIAALELELRLVIGAAADVAEARAQQAADRAADKAAADAARAERLARQQLADALPSLAEVRRAFVRGFVDVQRYRQAVIAAHPGIADVDAAALVADAQADADQYAAQQAAHAAALARDKDPALPLATLETSVVDGITSIDTYDVELKRRGYDDDERRILVALVQGRVADQKDRAAAKARADAKAKTAGISVADFERAVRLGLRTPQQYAELLAQLQVPDVERAVLVDLLGADLAADKAAAAKRAQLDAAAKSRAIDLPLRRRAALAGVITRDQYRQALNAAGVSTDEQTIELGLFDLELAHQQQTAGAALPLRRKAVLAGYLELADYEAAALAAGVPAADVAIDVALLQGELQRHPPAIAAGPTLTLAQVESAVVLGVLTPDDLRAWLADKGYSDDDAEVLVSLVVARIPDTRQAQTTQSSVTAELRAKGVQLADLERGALRGLATLDSYADELRARGYGDDAITLLRALLAERQALQVDKLRAAITAALAGADGAPSLAEFDDAVRSGAVSPSAARQYLQTIGVARDAALVYVRLVPTLDAEPAP